MASETKTLPFTDPSIRWYVKPSLNHTKIITGNTPVAGAINYSCDDIICFPRYYGGYLSWYNSSTGDIGSRMFDRQEAWDHVTRINPNTSYPYNGRAVIIPGYGGYLLAATLTDGSNIVQVNIIRRYLDDTILIYNTGKYGTNSYNISVTVNDPPGGYSVQTNGTRGTGTTTLAPGQYVLFYKGTAPAVDTANGLFSKSPFGVGKSQPYELRTNAFTHAGLIINVPQMYLGVKAPTDMEVISNGAYPGAHMTYVSSGASGNYGHPLWSLGGQDARRYIGGGDWYNTSRIIDAAPPGMMIYKNDPNTVSWAGGNQIYNKWFGWGEDENGNVKFILFSQFYAPANTDFKEVYRLYIAYIYDVERNEAYVTAIIKPTIDTYNYGEGGAVLHPFFSTITDEGSVGASAFAYIDANDAWNKTTTAASTTYTYHDSAYGFCNYCGDKIICNEGLGIYTTDANYTPPAPKSAFGASRLAGKIGAFAVRIPSLGDRTLYAGKIYAAVARLKTFPGTTSDADIQNWFKALQPKSLTSDDYNGMLRVLPGSFWLFGKTDDTVNITAPSSIGAGSQFTVNVSCSARPNKPLWVALIDKDGNIVTSNSGTTDGSGNASVTLTAPNTTGTYRVLAIVKGDRQLV